ncbi:hypothetical protein [Lentzea aerocolonigenes]|uniref:hypothetical protein n=1 Tax=Lentzea aerocolonigenes TaxID=68170 RepID=UPI000A4D8823|nr:hypothetical protein [Lentzea aerocolonigenes]
MRIFLWLLGGVAAVLLVWLFAAWNIAFSGARRDAVSQIQDITPALRAAAADGSLTPEEISAIGTFEVSREDGEVRLRVHTHAERSWWMPLASGTATSDRRASWVVNGAYVTIYPGD